MANTSERLAAAVADRYLFERELGSGGMATVYLAQDRKHGRKVAIKVLRPELAAALGTERFVREIEIAAKLTHPHILPLFDSGEADGFLYYVMPYVEGESLRDRLNRESRLSVQEAIRLTDQIASALAYADERGVVHRDIKPENILLAGNQAIVADFGIARAVEAAGGEKLTGTGLAAEDRRSGRLVPTPQRSDDSALPGTVPQGPGFNTGRRPAPRLGGRPQQGGKARPAVRNTASPLGRGGHGGRRVPHLAHRSRANGVHVLQAPRRRGRSRKG
jgi:serine/threonine protein kinase